MLDKALNTSLITNLTLSWRRSLLYRNQPFICSANQYTGFYMIRTIVMKELNTQICRFANWIFPNLCHILEYVCKISKSSMQRTLTASQLVQNIWNIFSQYFLYIKCFKQVIEIAINLSTSKYIKERTQRKKLNNPLYYTVAQQWHRRYLFCNCRIGLITVA